ncbi:short chain dehydrogenase [Hypoxylon trugodes]|uniref:short chain dehydrogenase n=1 Tax=Hypoxylon trugodes TaxID=326681 RepID=UPI0021A07713|nr:short chain dehydrogenase [Hypoxylon trugodes]KAI1382721.1 short chain dehydrogenase [Hypoxylon trugodes]
MQPPLPCPTVTWHNDTYPSISPSRPEQNVNGKTIVVVGAGSGIGGETALTFATAGTARIALLGRTETSLQETASLVPRSSVHVADLTNAKSLIDAAAAVGKWHLLILSSGYCPDRAPVVLSEVEDWWKGFETNVKGTLLAAKTFIPTADADATVIGVASDTSLVSADHTPGLSGYASSKLAQVKIYEFLAAENPNLFVATVNPGMVETDNFHRAGGRSDKLPMNKGGFLRIISLGAARCANVHYTTSVQFNYLHTLWCGWPALKLNSYELAQFGQIGMSVNLRPK